MRPFLRTLLIVLTSFVVAATLTSPVQAGPNQQFPDLIQLPLGWQAEGIATGPGSTVYSGSLASGAIWKGDLRTGAGDILVPGRTGGVAAGLKYSRGLLYVSGGPTGLASVYDARTGIPVVTCAVGTPGATFVNDVTVTRDAAWFTDSAKAVLYRLPINHGRPSCPTAPPLALGGDWQQVTGFNANGIDATPDGRTLIVVNSALATLFTVDPSTGLATRIDSVPMTNGDGILLRGRQLYVVQNRLNQIAVLRLSADLGSATKIRTLNEAAFNVPTTVAAFGRTLYVVNAKFGTPPAGTKYEIVKVDGY